MSDQIFMRKSGAVMRAARYVIQQADLVREAHMAGREGQRDMVMGADTRLLKAVSHWSQTKAVLVNFVSHDHTPALELLIQRIEEATADRNWPTIRPGLVLELAGLLMRGWPEPPTKVVTVRAEGSVQLDVTAVMDWLRADPELLKKIGAAAVQAAMIEDKMASVILRDLMKPAEEDDRGGN